MLSLAESAGLEGILDWRDLTPIPSRSPTPSLVASDSPRTKSAELLEVPKLPVSAKKVEPEKALNCGSPSVPNSISPATPETAEPPDKKNTLAFLDGSILMSDSQAHIKSQTPVTSGPTLYRSATSAKLKRKKVAAEASNPSIPTSTSIVNGTSLKRFHVAEHSQQSEFRTKRRRIPNEYVSNQLSYQKHTSALAGLELLPSTPEGVVQDFPCTKLDSRKHYELKCFTCRAKQSGDSCRFRGNRILLTQNGNCTGKLISRAEEQQHFDFPTEWNTDLQPYLSHLKYTISISLLETLKLEMKHLQDSTVLYRPWEESVRATCDSCLTSLFSCTWFCSCCGREFCSECLAKLTELHLNPELLPRNSRRPTQKVQRSNNSSRHTGDRSPLLKCNTRHNHGPSDFLPVSRFRLDHISSIIDEMEQLLLSMLHRDAGTYGQEVELTNTAIGGGEFNPLDIPSHDTITVASSALTHSKFADLWKQHRPIVVEGIVPQDETRWTPQYIIGNYGNEACPIENCQTGEQRLSSVREFFEMYGRGIAEPWKLKDWPTTDDFKNVFPKHFDDFQKIVPAPNYSRRDGVLNLVSHFPKNTIAPDIGPKMYNALATEDKPGTLGTTKLHMDMADAVNIMVHAESVGEKQGTAVWDIYRAEDSEKIRNYLKRFPSPFKLKQLSDGSIPEQDPIHMQGFYLDPVKRRELYDEYGVYSHRIHQKPGQAVFIPAGCAHQVINLADCIKVAVDFVSPENIRHCMRLTDEFRNQNQVKCWKEDILQLKTMMWYSWLSCTRFEGNY